MMAYGKMKPTYSGESQLISKSTRRKPCPSSPSPLKYWQKSAWKILDELPG